MKNFINNILSNIIVLLFSGLILSSGNSILCQWVQISNGMNTNNIIYYFAAISNNLFAGTATGVYLTTNNGNNWISKSSGLPGTNIFSLVNSGNDLYAGCLLGVYKSTNNGENWTQVLNGIHAYHLTVNYYNRIFAGTDGNGVYVSSNNGVNWVQSNSGITDLNIKCMSNHSHTFAGTQSGIFYSYDGGAYWGTYNQNLTNLNITALSGQGSDLLYAGTLSAGVFRYMGGSTYWQQVNSGLNSLSIRSFKTTNQFALAGTNSGMCVTTNMGTNWTVKNEGFSTPPAINAITINNGYIFAGSANFSVWRRPLSDVITGITQLNNHVPADFMLYQNYPNPFNPTTKIIATLSPSNVGKQDVKLVIYDASGKEIAVYTPPLERGQEGFLWEVEWNASNYPSGIYFYTLVTETFIVTKKMVLIK